MKTVAELPHFIYIHGFNSSPLSFKAELTKQLFERMGIADKLDVPELPHWPELAMIKLRSLVEQYPSVVLIGSSLGGFYATWFSEHYDQVRAVLVNPAVAPQRLLKDLLGETENYHTGEKYMLTDEHMHQLEHYYLERLNHPERLLLLQQEGDETLDYRDAVSYYVEAQQIVQPGGSHAFEDFEKMLPVILSFAANDYP